LCEFEACSLRASARLLNDNKRGTAAARTTKHHVWSRQVSIISLVCLESTSVYSQTGVLDGFALYLLTLPAYVVINVITGPPNGPVLFCSLASVVVCRLSSSVTLPASGRAGRPLGARAIKRPTLHGGPVMLRPVRATPC